MVIEAGFECATPVFFLTHSRDRNEENAAAPGRSANLRRQLVAIHIWKADVEKNCNEGETSRHDQAHFVRYKRLDIVA